MTGQNEVPAARIIRQVRAAIHGPMTYQQTSRTNITEALREEQRYSSALSDALLRMGHHSVGKHQAPTQYDSDSERACPYPYCLAALAAEPRSDAVTAPDDCLNCGAPIAPTHCQACGECDPTPEARAASASVPPHVCKMQVLGEPCATCRTFALPSLDEIERAMHNLPTATVRVQAKWLLHRLGGTVDDLWSDAAATPEQGRGDE